MKLGKWLAGSILAAAVAGAGVGHAMRSGLPDVRGLAEFRPPVMSQVAAADGSVLDTFAEQRRIVIDHDDIPRAFIQALLATEDAGFERHMGVDLRGIARAVLADVRTMRFSQGASTLTMQLARALFLHQGKTVRRKVQEALLALEIERQYTKEEILRLYCNQIYMGHGRYGLEAASRFYLGKPAERMNLSESALLAGLIQRPEAYSPFRHPDRAMKRREHVLSRMVHHGYLDAEAAKRVGRAPLALRGPATTVDAPHFVEEVRRRLSQRHGGAIYREGLRVGTTLDPEIQRLANRAVREGLGRLHERHGWSREDGPVPEAALVAIDPRSGEVRALIGGSDFDSSEWNRATQARRQTGSAFKPFVFAAALARGRTLADRIVDEPTVFVDPWSGKPYQPENYSRAYDGSMTLRHALEESANIPTVKLLLDVGYAPVIDLARELGIRSRLDPFPSLALGAFEATLLELTGAYAAFANAGIWFEPHLIREVLDRDGRYVYRARPAFREIMRPGPAYLIHRSLEGVITDGTGRSATLGFPAAGKTGTTDRNTDAWFVGYTSELAVGVWVGFDDNRSLGQGETGARAALPIWTQFMESVNALHDPAPEPVPPPSIVFASIDRETGLLARPGTCDRVLREAFLRGTEPAATCPHHGPVLRALPWPLNRFELDEQGRVLVPATGPWVGTDGRPARVVLLERERLSRP